MQCWKRWLGTCVAVGALLPAGSAPAHHSFAATYDASTTIELDGVVTAVRWRNPHVSFDLKVESQQGGAKSWDIETLAIAGLERRNINHSFVSIGDHIKVAGNPGRRGNDLYLSNILLANGKEIVLRADKKPRFSHRLVGTTGSGYATKGDASQPELGIFRVWTTPNVSPFPFPEDVNPALARTNFPLTSSARAAVQAYDPLTDNPLLHCALKGMPTIMEQPYPMKFTKTANGDILLHAEEYDTTRTIHMNPDAEAAAPSPSLLGYSRGHWEGQTLVVETTALGWGHYDTVGIPLSEDAKTVERFTLAKDGSRLDWSMTITDPATFTKPVTLKKYFFYVPHVELKRFHCQDN